MVQLEAVESGAQASELRELIEQHHRLTGSSVAARVLEHWTTALEEFVQVMPVDYKRVLAEDERKQAAPPRRHRRTAHGQTHRLQGVLAPGRPLPGRGGATRDLRRVPRAGARGASAHAGRALHGLRRAVLPVRLGLPDRQPDPGVERPGLSRPLAGGARPSPPHQQLPRVHRPRLPGAVRGRLRARHHRPAR